MSYQRNAMESRRTIQIRVFTGYIVLCLVILQAASDALMGPAGNISIKLLFQTFYLLIFLIFTGFIFQIEISNRHNRQNYHHMERRLLELLRIKPMADPVSQKSDKTSDIPNEPFTTSLRRSWAATWPLATCLVITTMSILLLEALPMNSAILSQTEHLDCPVTQEIIRSQDSNFSIDSTHVQ